MSDKILKHRLVVAIDKPLKSMQEQLKSINDIFNKQREEIKKAIGAVGNLADTYKKFEIGKLEISGLSTALSGVTGIAGKGIDLMKDFGASAVDAMQFRERAVFSLGRAFGDGSKKLQEVIDIASKTTMDTGPMVTMANALSTSFKHWDDVKKITTPSKEEAIRIATGYVNSGGSSFKDSIKNAVEVKSFDPEFNLYFGNSVKKEDAEYIVKTVADKVKESIDSKGRAAKELRKSGGKS